MRTKIYLLLIAFVATIGSASGQSIGDTFVDGNGFNYVITGATVPLEVRLTRGGNYSGDIVIPQTVTHPETSATYAVVEIEYGAFQNLDDLISVTIQEGVRSIGGYAFFASRNLRTVIFPPTLSNVGVGLFNNCESLTNVVLPEGMTAIKEGFFVNNFNLTTLNIPSTVTDIEPGSFLGCINFTRFTVDAASTHFSVDGEGVLFNEDKTEVVVYPFGKTASSYIMPLTVERARFDFGDVFNNTALADISGGNPSLFKYSEGVMYNGLGTELIFCPVAKTGDVNALNGVTSILPGAFKNGNVSKINMPATVTSIGIAGEEGLVFAYSKKLTEINVAGGTSYLSEDGVLFDAGKTKLLAYPADKDGSRYSLVAKPTVEKVGAYAFAGNRNLEILVCGSKVKEIERYAFSMAESLKTVESIENVTDLGRAAFHRSTLEYINLPENPNFKVVPESSLSECLNLTSIVVPANVEMIHSNAFNGSLYLKDVTLNEGLQTIMTQAFMGTGITEITIPASVTRIREAAFNNSKELREVEFLSDDPTSLIINNNAFASTSDDLIIVVPVGAESQYEALLSGVGLPPSVSILGLVEIIIESGGHDLKFVDEDGNVLDELPGGITNKDYVILPKDDEKFEVIDVQVDGSTANKNSDDEFYVTLDGDKVIEVTVVPKKVVTFISNGNTTLQYVKNGGLAIAPSVSNPGHDLQGWFAGGVAWNFTTPVTADMTLTAQWTSIPAPKATYTVTMTPLAGVDVPPTRVGSHSVEEGGAFSFSARATSATSTLTVLVNGAELSPASDNFYMIDNIRENKAITFKLTAGGSTPNPDTDPVAPGDGNDNNNNGGGQIIIDENTPSDLPGEFPPTGEIIVRPPLVDPDSSTPPTVIIDGKEVEGEWKTDEDGNPIFVIEFDDLEDGKHTLIINNKEFEFTVDKNARPTSNDVLSVAKVSASYGAITIETPKSAMVQVVSFSGSVVYNAKVVGTATVNVPAGIYVVVVDGSVTKVVVR